MGFVAWVDGVPFIVFPKAGAQDFIFWSDGVPFLSTASAGGGVNFPALTLAP